MFRNTLVIALFISSSNFCNAQIVFVFDNENTAIGGGLNGEESGKFTVGGLEITVIALGGKFNSNANFFGINDIAENDVYGFDVRPEGSGGPGGTGPEQFTFSFNRAVSLSGFSVSSFETDDRIDLISSDGLLATIGSNGETNLTFNLDTELEAGEEVLVLTTGGTFGNGWSLDNISVSSFSAVPEPGSIVFLCLLGGGFLARRRYLSNKKSAEESRSEA